MSIEERLQEVLDAHFDPRWGSPWWTGRARALGFDPREEIRCVADLERLPAVPREALASLPVESFVPVRHHERRREWVVSETGGTTGPPGRTIFLPEDFEAAFVAPFVAAAARFGFPRGESWLFIGPTGPHVIGKAARACALASGGMEPFAVDLDPRWVRRLAPGSLARRRYTEHVLEQCRAILTSQDVGVLFGTPPLLAALGERLEASLRERITGIHLGGMAADAAYFDRLSEEWFPRAVVLSGYGNSLAGVCLEVAADRAAGPAYFPFGDRLVLDVVDAGASGRGRVRFHRLDPSGLLPNVLERDEAAAAKRAREGVEDGFAEWGLLDPRPPAGEARASGRGLY